MVSCDRCGGGGVCRSCACRPLVDSCVLAECRRRRQQRWTSRTSRNVSYVSDSSLGSLDCKKHLYCAKQNIIIDIIITPSHRCQPLRILTGNRIFSGLSRFFTTISYIFRHFLEIDFFFLISSERVFAVHSSQDKFIVTGLTTYVFYLLYILIGLHAFSQFFQLTFTHFSILLWICLF